MPNFKYMSNLIDYNGITHVLEVRHVFKYHAEKCLKESVLKTVFKIYKL